MQLVAYEIYGGGACPSQFYWHNKDNTRWYYFRYRNGHWTLRESTEDIDKGSGYDKSKIIAEGYEGDSLDGYCTIETMKKWFLCPYCRKKIIKYDKDAYSKGVFLLCKKCGKEIEIKINKENN